MRNFKQTDEQLPGTPSDQLLEDIESVASDLREADTIDSKREILGRFTSRCVGLDGVPRPELNSAEQRAVSGL